jgi:acyl carrier protein
MTPIADKIISIISDFFHATPGEITPATTWTDLSAQHEADSLDVVEMVMEIEEEFDTTIPDDAIEKFKTVADLVAFVVKADSMTISAEVS